MGGGAERMIAKISMHLIIASTPTNLKFISRPQTDEDEEELEPRFEANRPFVFADDEELPLLEDVLATEVPCSISFFFSSSSTNLFMRIIKFRFAH